MRKRSRRSGASATLLPVLVLAGVSVLGGCGFGGSDTSSSSVFSAKVGQCFAAPTEVKAQISDLDRVPCAKAHDQEAFALVTYPSGDKSGTYPGDDVLDQFAQGACAQRFGAYVGVDYLDSAYFFTYLTPSPRSWQENDRTTICLVTDAGKPMTGSVKGSAL
jgi:hypothetical protein